MSPASRERYFQCAYEFTIYICMLISCTSIMLGGRPEFREGRASSSINK